MSIHEQVKTDAQARGTAKVLGEELAVMFDTELPLRVFWGALKVEYKKAIDDEDAIEFGPGMTTDWYAVEKAKAAGFKRGIRRVFDLHKEIVEMLRSGQLPEGVLGGGNEIEHGKAARGSWDVDEAPRERGKRGGEGEPGVVSWASNLPHAAGERKG